MKNRKSPTLLHRLEYAALRAGAALLNMLPLDIASALMGWLWRIFARFNHRHSTVLKNLREAFPDEDGRWIKTCAARHWNNLGRTFAEGLCLQKLMREDRRIQLSSKQLIASLKGQGRGCVFVSLHMGNWEIIVKPALEAGFQMAGIYQKAANPLVEDYLKRVRGPLYPGGLYAKRRTASASIIRWVRQGHAVCMMADLRNSSGVKVPFFGKPTPSNPFPALVAEKLGVPLIAARCKRLQGVRFEIEAIEIPQAKDGTLDERIQSTTARLHAQFEKWVRQNPDQWMWGHRRR